MATVTKAKQLTITAQDKLGLLAEVSGAMSGAGVNIEALCAYAMEGAAYFMMVTNNFKQAQSAASAKGWKTEETDVLVVGIKDKVGAASEIATQLKGKNVNLQYCYGSTCSCSAQCDTHLVIKPDDIDAAVKALQ